MRCALIHTVLSRLLTLLRDLRFKSRTARLLLASLSTIFLPRLCGCARILMKYTSVCPLIRFLTVKSFVMCANLHQNQSSRDSNSAWVKLLLGLRALVSRSSAVLWISAPALVFENTASANQRASHYHVQETAGTARISHLGDIAMDVHSFVGNGSFSENALAGFGDFDGILRIVRLPAFHSIAPPAAATATAETPNYLFKVRRARNFI